MGIIASCDRDLCFPQLVKPLSLPKPLGDHLVERRGHSISRGYGRLIAVRLGRAVYLILRRGDVFDEAKFLQMASEEAAAVIVSTPAARRRQNSYSCLKQPPLSSAERGLCLRKSQQPASRASRGERPSPQDKS
jgi:hypothetical protein